MIGSVAAFEPYAGGGGYNAAKAAVSALADVLRIESLGQPLRVSEIDPGMVETEFSIVRFYGDTDKAAAVYAGMTPLTAEDVAEAVVWVASRPSHVDIDRLVMRPRAQARVHMVHREALPRTVGGTDRPPPRQDMIGAMAQSTLLVVGHPAVTHRMAELRDAATGPDRFRELVHQITSWVAYEALRDLRTVDIT